MNFRVTLKPHLFRAIVVLLSLYTLLSVLYGKSPFQKLRNLDEDYRSQEDRGPGVLRNGVSGSEETVPSDVFL